MFDKIIDFLLSILEKLLPFTVVKQYQNGALLRFGKLHRILDPGLHFKWPFVDEVEVNHILTTTMNTPAQSLVTKDDKKVVAKAVIKYRATDISKFYTDVYDSLDVLSDVAMGLIKDAIVTTDYQQCKGQEIDKQITRKLKVEVKKWGIEVINVTLTDFSIVSSLRLFNEQIKDPIS